MCWGNVKREEAYECVGKGWKTLIDECYDIIAPYPEIIVVQIKEKFGGLRFYTDYINEDVDDKINEVENRSFKICEDCGNPASENMLKYGGWYLALCDEDWTKRAIERGYVEIQTISTEGEV